MKDSTSKYIDQNYLRMYLEISNLKTFDKGVQANKYVNLNIFNTIFGLLDQNGKGKSSPMRTIATLQEPDREV
jgi:ABC-type uncharacterized transport system ATPase subunit